MEVIKKGYKFLTDPKYRFDLLSNKGFYDGMDDRTYLSKKYESIYGERLDLDNPTKFTEKLQWLKLYDRNPIYTTIVDKISFKDYISRVIGGNYVIPTLAVYENTANIDYKLLPNRFVFKTNHDSGGAIVCMDKSHFDFVEAQEKLERRLERNYYLGCREWCYKNIVPRIMVEPFISCKNKFNREGLIDYKFYCFSGEPVYLMVSFDEASKQHINHKYDMQFCSIDSKFRKDELVPAETFEKPANFDEMKHVVKVLCEGFPHVRVDLYNVNGMIFVGELTLYSNGGFINIPLEMDSYLGALVNLDMAYKG